MESEEPEWLRLTVKTKSCISLLPLKTPYSFQWLRESWHKNTLLAKIFYFGDTGIEIERKKGRFKEFIGQFKHEIYRRDTRFVIEGRKNEKVYIVSRGEARIYKEMRVRSSKGETLRNAEILYIREGALIGAELFLMNSKAIHAIISNHAAMHGQEEVKEEESEEDSDE
jgi:hypothetical protein